LDDTSKLTIAFCTVGFLSFIAFLAWLCVKPFPPLPPEAPLTIQPTPEGGWVIREGELKPRRGITLELEKPSGSSGGKVYPCTRVSRRPQGNPRLELDMGLDAKPYGLVI